MTDSAQSNAASRSTPTPQGWRVVYPTGQDPADASSHDENIIELCRAGNRAAQRRLFEQTSPRVYGLLLRLTGSQHDAEDLTQETYVKGFERIDQFDGRAAITSWLYRIAVNEALQLRRRRATGTMKLAKLASGQAGGSKAASADVRLDVEEALAELPPEDRALLLLRYQEGLDYRGIAEVIDCAEGTVASRLHRARERLRGILRKSYG